MKRIHISLLLSFILIFTLPAKSEIYYPWKDILVGALDASAWAGLMIIPDKENAFGFRIRVKRGDQVADGIDLFFLVSEVGPHSPDGNYARICFDMSLPFGKKRETPVLKKPADKSDTLTLEWSRQDEKTVVGKISIPKNIDVHLIHYFPWDRKGKYNTLPQAQVQGETIKGDKTYYLFWASRKGEDISNPETQEHVYSFTEEREIYFVLGVDKEMRILENRLHRYKNEKTIDSFLLEEQNRYEKKRVSINGSFSGAEKAITQNLFWMTLYQAEEHGLYIPAGRRWIFPQPNGLPDYWTIFEWDSFFNSLLVSIESSKHAKEIILSVLKTQYANGNIPNWRGNFGGTPDRSQPPVGSYVVLKLFQKTGDLDLLRFSYPFLKKWHSYWTTPIGGVRLRRDGNNDGLLEWGSDANLVPNSVPPWESNVSGKQRAMWESGQDDLPNWDICGFDDERGTLTMNCVDLSSLYALDAWCLAQMANILDKESEHGFYLDEYQNLKKLINSTLWNEKEGFYFDRHWDGRFSNKKASSNFYPLLARIPDEEQALRMLRHLLDSDEFWGDYVIPTISKDDPAFKDQQYWRGTIWPPTNYLVYQGLKAYRFDAAASEFAHKSASLFLRSWQNYQLCPENYDSRTGSAGGQRYQSWGPLFALIALEEYLDITPVEGFRFGMLNPERSGRISRISIQGRHYDLSISPREMTLKEEGKKIVDINGGAVIRHFFYSENEISFDIKSLKKRSMKIQFLSKGKYQFLLDNLIKKIFKGKSIKIKIPEGEHRIILLLLESEK